MLGVMKLSYDLSNRQRDALNKGQTLTLAIPLDPEGDDIIAAGDRSEVERWISEKLPTLGKYYVQFKGVFPIVVAPKINPIGSDLSKRLGDIRKSTNRMVGFGMDVATVEVVNPDRPRGDCTNVQWPGGDLTLA